ncbi:hypothetical protein Tco_1439267 [Tanacetum coccineum]
MQTAKDLEEPAHQEFETGVTKDQPDEDTSQLLDWFQKPAKPPTPYRDWNKTLPDAYGPVQPWLSSLAQMEDPRESFNELMDTPIDFSAFMMNRLKVDTLTPELLAGLTFELMKGSCKSLLYTFKEGDFNRLLIQDIEDMLLLLVQGKLTNLTVKERLAFNVSLRMFIRSVVIQRRMEDIQLGVESYQKKLNLTMPNTYRSDLKRKEAYLAYSNPRGFIYQNKDKKNRLMRIDELYKFGDGTLNDVWTALNDRLKGIRMKYLPQTIWRQSDRDKAGAMIQAIDKQLKTKRIMRSLEKFIDKMDSMHSTLSMYYNYDAHVKGELLMMMKNSQSVNLLIFISNTLIELFNDFGFDCDGILERLTMYLNLWCYKVVRYRYSNPMIQPELEGSTQGYPLDSVEVLRILKDGGEVKEFQRSFRHSDTERLSRSDEVLKLKNFKKDATLKLFKSTNQERYEHVRPEVTRLQDGKVYKMAKQDYAWLMISMCSR